MIGILIQVLICLLLIAILLLGLIGIEYLVMGVITIFLELYDEFESLKEVRKTRGRTK